RTSRERRPCRVPIARYGVVHHRGTSTARREVVGQPETKSSGHHCREDKVSAGSKWIDGLVKCVKSFQTHNQEVDHEEGCASSAQTLTDGSDDLDHTPPPITGLISTAIWAYIKGIDPILFA